eukprot:scaffold54707_cov67-Cyclotella_meneghiniana.AAC.2
MNPPQSTAGPPQIASSASIEIFVLPSIQSWAQAHRSQKAESDSVSVGSESSGENSDSVSESKEEEL